MKRSVTGQPMIHASDELGGIRNMVPACPAAPQRRRSADAERRELAIWLPDAARACTVKEHVIRRVFRQLSVSVGSAQVASRPRPKLDIS
eukprot:6212258-Pleurochrysis_carterae.AAC.2